MAKKIQDPLVVKLRVQKEMSRANKSTRIIRWMARKDAAKVALEQ